MSKAYEDAADADVGETWERPTIFYNKQVKYLVYLVVVVAFLWSIWRIRITPERLVIGIGAGYQMIAEMLPPDFSGDNATRIWEGIIETLGMAIIATVAGVVVSIPVGFLASENLVSKPIYYTNQTLIIGSRAFHSLIVAILVVKAVGFGPLAGILTLTFKTIGFYGKLLSEEIEEINTGMMDAIRATGASPFQLYVYAVFPQVLPRLVGLSVYQWDINLRQSAVIGIVGAGGIGMTLIVTFQRYDYAFSSAIVLVIIGLVILGEIISQLGRNRVM